MSFSSVDRLYSVLAYDDALQNLTGATILNKRCAKLHDVTGTNYSLQTPRSSNIDAERHPFDSNKLIADKLARTPSTTTTSTSASSSSVYIPYMHQVPGVGGMVFFPEAWTEFR
jgi:hypothetical protein